MFCNCLCISHVVQLFVNFIMLCNCLWISPCCAIVCEFHHVVQLFWYFTMFYNYFGWPIKTLLLFHFFPVTSACMLLTAMMDICQIKKSRPHSNLEEVKFYFSQKYLLVPKILFNLMFRTTTATVMMVWPSPSYQPMKNVCWHLNLVNTTFFMSRSTLHLNNCVRLITNLVNNKYFCKNTTFFMSNFTLHLNNCVRLITNLVNNKCFCKNTTFFM